MNAIEDTKWEHCIATQQGLAIDYLQTFMPLSRGKILYIDQSVNGMMT